MEPIAELIAEREIRKIIALYPQYADDGNAEGFAGLFAETGALVMGARRVSGHAQLAAWLPGTLQHGALRHIMTNAYIVVDTPETAHGSLDMVLLMKTGDAWAIRACPRYEDSYVRTSDGWKFLERNIVAKG